MMSDLTFIFIVTAVTALALGLFFIFGMKCGQQRGIRTGRIKRGCEVFYVVPWPEADPDSWAEYMRSIERDSGTHGIPSCYWQQWLQYVGKQLPLDECAVDDQGGKKALLSNTG